MAGQVYCRVHYRHDGVPRWIQPTASSFLTELMNGNQTCPLRHDAVFARSPYRLVPSSGIDHDILGAPFGRLQVLGLAPSLVLSNLMSGPFRFDLSDTTGPACPPSLSTLALSIHASTSRWRSGKWHQVPVTSSPPSSTLVAIHQGQRADDSAQQTWTRTSVSDEPLTPSSSSTAAGPA